MSRVKHPRDKKRLSLDRDRRNVYGENDKASRKNIPRSKQRSHMRIRRAATQELAKVKGDVGESTAMDAEALVKVRTTFLRKTGFRKMPDQSLRTVISQQKLARLYRAIFNALREAGIRYGMSDGVAIEGEAGVLVRVGPRDVSRARQAIRNVLKRDFSEYSQNFSIAK